LQQLVDQARTSVAAFAKRGSGDYHHGLFPHRKSAINKIVNGLAVVLPPFAGLATSFDSLRNEPNWRFARRKSRSFHCYDLSAKIQAVE
jgi:hypothetical protein